MHRYPVLFWLAAAGALLTGAARADVPANPAADARVVREDPFDHPLWREAKRSGAQISINFDFRNNWDRRVGLVHIEQYIERERAAGRNPAMDQPFVTHLIQLLQTPDQALREQVVRMLGLLDPASPLLRAPGGQPTAAARAVRTALLAAAANDLPVPPAILARGIDEEIEAWGRDGQGVRDRALPTLARLFRQDPEVLSTVLDAMDRKDGGQYTLDSYAAAEALRHLDLGTILGTRPLAVRQRMVQRIQAWQAASGEAMPEHPDDRDAGQALEGQAERTEAAQRHVRRAVGQPGAAPFFANPGPGANQPRPALNQNEEERQGWLQGLQGLFVAAQ